MMVVKALLIFLFSIGLLIWGYYVYWYLRHQWHLFRNKVIMRRLRKRIQAIEDDPRVSIKTKTLVREALETIERIEKEANE